MKDNKIGLTAKDLEKIAGGNDLTSKKLNKTPVEQDGLKIQLVRYAAPRPPYQKPTTPTDIDTNIKEDNKDVLSKLPGDTYSEPKK